MRGRSAAEPQANGWLGLARSVRSIRYAWPPGEVWCNLAEVSSWDYREWRCAPTQVRSELISQRDIPAPDGRSKIYRTGNLLLFSAQIGKYLPIGKFRLVLGLKPENFLLGKYHGQAPFQILRLWGASSARRGGRSDLPSPSWPSPPASACASSSTSRRASQRPRSARSCRCSLRSASCCSFRHRPPRRRPMPDRSLDVWLLGRTCRSTRPNRRPTDLHLRCRLARTA